MCDCIDVFNEKLKKHNMEIMLPIMLGADQTRRVMIRTDKIESSKRAGPVGVFATFCPFCGVNLGE